MSRVEYEQVRKQFPGQAAPAVDGLDLDVPDGELLVLLGPSGCGKTTALRMLAGLEWPDGGDIRIDGGSVVRLEPKDRDVALVFQSYALYPHMTARDNILYPLRVRRMGQAERDHRGAAVGPRRHERRPPDEFGHGPRRRPVVERFGRARLEQAAELLGLTGLLDRKPAQLSGGEQQRVALGRAIVREPRVFLMDEPLSNLDAKLRTHMRTELKALQRQLGVTTIFVTHDQAEAMTMADRIAVFNAGRLQQLGSPDEVYQRPANLFVAEFIGSPPMNILEAERQGDRLVTAAGWQLPAPPALDGRGEGALMVGLRPEAIDLRLDPAPGAQPAEVFMTEPLGSEVIINVKVGEKLVKVRAEPELRPQPGQTAYLTADRRGLRVFDAQSGEALA